MKRIPQLAILVVALLSLLNPFFVKQVLAVNEYPITGLRDLYFTLVENSQIQILGNTNETCDVVTTDPMLWVYDSENVIVAFDDDSNFRLPDGQPNPDQLNQCVSSKIEILLSAGDYRLRAGYWTSPNDPDFVPTITNIWDLTYTVVTDLVLTDTITPPTTTTTTTETPTTTTETPTTTTEVTTSTSTEAPTTTILTIPPTTTLPEEPTWPPTTESTPPTTTSTTTVPTTTVPVTSLPTPSTVVPTTVVPVITTVPQTTEPVTVPATDPPTTDTPTTTVPELPSEPSTTPPTAPETTTTTLPPIVEGEALEPEIAVAYATDPEVLAVATASEATEIFDAIIVEDLTPEQAAEIIEAVQEAPPEVREAFEEEINVFDGTFDTYTPLGSAIPVSTRRTVTAAIAAIGITTPISSRKKTK